MWPDADILFIAWPAVRRVRRVGAAPLLVANVRPAVIREGAHNLDVGILSCRRIEDRIEDEAIVVIQRQLFEIGIRPDPGE